MREAPGDQELQTQTSQRWHGRVHALDGVRGIAAVVVMVQHSLIVIPAMAPPYGSRTFADRWLVHSPLHVFWAGGEAVYVFFVLSGIVLTLPVLNRAHFGWNAYYPARILRLYIPVAGAVALAYLSAQIVSRAVSPGASSWMQENATPVGPLRALADISLLAGTSPLIGPLWSLRWEVVFSLALPLYIWLARRLRRIWTVACVGSILMIAVPHVAGFPAASYLLMFAVGVLLAAHWGPVQEWSSRQSNRTWMALFAFAWLGITAYWTLGLWITGERLVAVAEPIAVAAAALLIVVGTGWRPARNLLGHRVVQWLGLVSFSLYLTHTIVVITVAHLLPQDRPGLVAPVAIPVAILFAWGFFRAVERPSHLLSRAVARHLQRNPD